MTCKKCRRLGVSVCGRIRCAVMRKPYPPGSTPAQLKRRRRNLSEYGMQLKEKQIVKFSYGLRERQFRNYVMKSMKSKDSANTQRLITFLESRLDNVIYRLGFATSRNQARQIVSHGHIHVNGRRQSFPSYHVKTGDIVSVRPQSGAKGIFKDLDIRLKKHVVPAWITLDKKKNEATIIGAPQPGTFDIPANINSVMEFYSR
ncbi:MAG: 30S ribosomal protein S4 [Candidatus Niyogibacteria bacterium]|nr:30S ribosomal protein S4 [Candidatus Niyogibacteria bacterium]